MKVEHVMGVVTAGFVADALWRRRRAARLRSLPPSAEPLADAHGLSAAELEELTARLKRCAPTATDVVVTPAIAPVGRTGEDRRAILRRRWLNDLPTYLSGNVIGLGAFAAGAVLARGWGVAALAAACAQPYLATLGTPLRPHDRRRFALCRPVAAPYRWLRVAAAADERDPELPRLRGEFAAELAGSVSRFQDPRLSIAGLTFHYLDMSGSVEEAARLGWADRGHLGFLPQLADELAGAYDVVSMHHYLEHTADPHEELDAAARVLPPGGHLLVEVPDPEWPIGRLAGRWWHCWFQPQHLHLIPVGNLVEALADRGLETVEVHRGPRSNAYRVLARKRL